MSEPRQEPDRIDELSARVKTVEDSLVVTEPNIVWAVGRFAKAYSIYQSQGGEFPVKELKGVAYAYFRPRFVLVLGSCAAIVFAALQVWILLNQNQILERQSHLMDAQTSANKIEAVIAVLSTLRDNPNTNVETLKLLATEDYYDTVRAMITGETEVSRSLRRSVVAVAESHSPLQARNTLYDILNHLIQRDFSTGNLSHGTELALFLNNYIYNRTYNASQIEKFSASLGLTRYEIGHWILTLQRLVNAHEIELLRKDINLSEIKQIENSIDLLIEIKHRFLKLCADENASSSVPTALEDYTRQFVIECFPGDDWPEPTDSDAWDEIQQEVWSPES